MGTIKTGENHCDKKVFIKPTNYPFKNSYLEISEVSRILKYLCMIN